MVTLATKGLQARHHWFPELSQHLSHLAYGKGKMFVCDLIKQRGDLCCWHHQAYRIKGMRLREDKSLMPHIVLELYITPLPEHLLSCLFVLPETFSTFSTRQSFPQPSGIP